MLLSEVPLVSHQLAHILCATYSFLKLRNFENLVIQQCGKPRLNKRFFVKITELFLVCFYLDSEMPNYNKLIPSLLEHGLEALPRYCHLTPGKFDQITNSYAALKTSNEEPECTSRRSGIAQPSVWPGFDSDHGAIWG